MGEKAVVESVADESEMVKSAVVVEFLGKEIVRFEYTASLAEGKNLQRLFMLMLIPHGLSVNVQAVE